MNIQKVANRLNDMLSPPKAQGRAAIILSKPARIEAVGITPGWVWTVEGDKELILRGYPVIAIAFRIAWEGIKQWGRCIRG